MTADVICFGEAGWDLFADGVLTRPRRFLAAPGGAAVNTARALARMRLRVGVCCAVGEDALGQGLVDRLRSDGVGVRLVRRGPARTPVVLVGAHGGSFLSLRRIEDELEAMEGLAPPRWGARHVHVAALLPGRRAARIYRRIAELTRVEGCTLSVDVDARPRFWRQGGELPWAIVRACDFVKCSVADLVATGLGRGARAIRELSRRVGPGPTVLVTDGARSTRAVGAWGELVRTPRPLSRAVPIGAGDAFSGGVIAELLAWRGGARDEAHWGRAVDRGHAAARAAMRRTRAVRV